jgi:hypothetical protein
MCSKIYSRLAPNVPLEIGQDAIGVVACSNLPNTKQLRPNLMYAGVRRQALLQNATGSFTLLGGPLMFLHTAVWTLLTFLPTFLKFWL